MLLKFCNDVKKMYEIEVKRFVKTTTSYSVGLKMITFSHKAHISTADIRYNTCINSLCTCISSECTRQ